MTNLSTDNKTTKTGNTTQKSGLLGKLTEWTTQLKETLLPKTKEVEEARNSIKNEMDTYDALRKIYSLNSFWCNQFTGRLAEIYLKDLDTIFKEHPDKKDIDHRMAYMELMTTFHGVVEKIQSGKLSNMEIIVEMNKILK